MAITFMPVIKHNTIGDFLLVLLNDDLFETEWIDSKLTVHRSIETQEVCGCQIWQVSRLAKAVINSFDVEHDDGILQLILESAVGTDPRKEHYYDLTNKIRTITLPEEVVQSIRSAAA
jgi:hypothetical protein